MLIEKNWLMAVFELKVLDLQLKHGTFVPNKKQLYNLLDSWEFSLASIELVSSTYL